MLHIEDTPEAETSGAIPTGKTTFLSSITDSMLANMIILYRSFIMGIRSIDRSITHAALQQLFADKFLGILFHEKIGHLGGNWSQIRTCITFRGVILKQHTTSRIILTLADGFCKEAKD